MKSVAIKTNNSQIIEYLTNNFLEEKFKDITVSYRKFKHFNNIIIHYKGNNISYFSKELATILSFLVVYEYEESFLKQIIYHDYFYFSNPERADILENCFNIMIDSDSIMKEKFQTIFTEFSNHLKNNKNIYLGGFINFRLTAYMGILRKIVEDSVNSYILEKEYNEFISLLKLYINSSETVVDVLHLVYSKDFTLILDKHKNIINNSADAFKAKFLSDISFSVNDYTLNTLLTLLPQKLYIHLVDNNMDEFITTLSLVFENRVEICTNCNICRLYNKNQSSK